MPSVVQKPQKKCEEFREPIKTSQKVLKNAVADLLIVAICKAKFQAFADKEPDVQILPENKIENPPVKNQYICTICTINVVRQPSACSKCETLFCKQCIVRWLKKNQTCPHCQKVFTASTVPRLVRMELEDMSFLCGQCPDVFSYNQALVHKKKCQALKLQCFLTCGSA
jgi:hypothetical protein